MSAFSVRHLALAPAPWSRGIGRLFAGILIDPNRVLGDCAVLLLAAAGLGRTALVEVGAPERQRAAPEFLNFTARSNGLERNFTPSLPCFEGLSQHICLAGSRLEKILSRRGAVPPRKGRYHTGEFRQHQLV